MGSEGATEGVKPSPEPDSISAHYWSGARRFSLDVQRCGQCGRYQHPPEAFCSHCRSEDLLFTEVGGRGEIVSFVIMRESPVCGFEKEVPFVFAVIELTEAARVRVLANIVGASRLKVGIGDAVSLLWEKRSDGSVVPQFQRAVADE